MMILRPIPVALLVLAIGCPDSAKNGAVPSDTVATPEAAQDVSTAPADAPTVEDTAGEDTAAPPDTSADTSDAANPPAGCCTTALDCAGAVCVATGDPYGVCLPAPATPGWCWDDAGCANGTICHGAAPCPCGSACDDEHPGVCVPKSGCAPIEPAWVQEICDAAGLVVFDGQQCVATCPGCCGCEPFCDLTFQSVGACEAACEPGSACSTWDGSCDDALPESPWWAFDGVSCVEIDTCVCEGCPGTFGSKAACAAACLGDPGECPAFITALAECPYALQTGAECPTAKCLTSPCTSDLSCQESGGAPLCVQGNCVSCWQDSQCGGGLACRGGRCVSAPASCPATPTCTAPGCSLVTASESPCPVCVCNSVFSKPCSSDLTCQMISSHPYSHCVYGRCAECRTDNECASGACLPPGLCYGMTPHPSTMYGTWVIGWFGGLDHFGYLRFEPDGTLRHGGFEPAGTFFDDFPVPPCAPDGGAPLLGTWEPEVTASGFLVLRMTVNASCDPGPGWTRRYLITQEDTLVQLKDVDGDQDVTGWRAADGACLPDMSVCETPVFPN